jgi:hypothetical protein
MVSTFLIEISVLETYEVDEKHGSAELRFSAALQHTINLVSGREDIFHQPDIAPPF